MKIETELLQKMVSKAIQGSSNNKMIPLTGLIGIEYKDEKLLLTTTDGANTFIVKEISDMQENENEFYTIVNAEQFSKLVSKTTKEFIELHNKDNYLEFKGNGTYKLDIAVNEEGNMIKFKNAELEEATIEEINLNDLQDAIKTAKASVAKTMEVPFLTGYYISNNVITTDRQLVCKLEKKITNEPILISNTMAELLLLIELGNEEKFTLSRKGNVLIFNSNRYILFGDELDGKNDFSERVVKSIDNLTKLSYTSEAVVGKQELLDVLDRMEIFVTEYDKNGVYLRFKKDDKVLEVQSLKSNNAVEKLQLREWDNANDFEGVIHIEMLKAQLQSLNLDVVKIQYGDQKSIQLVEGNTTLVIALLDVDK